MKALAHAAAVVGSAFVMAVAFARVPYTRYLADDFGLAALFRDLGFFGLQKEIFLNAGGRFAAVFLESFIWMAGRRFSFIFPALFLCALTAATIFVIRSARLLFPGRPPLVASATLAFTCSAALLDAARDHYQPIFWLSGLTFYGVPVLISLMIGGLTIAMAREGGSRLPQLILIGVLAFAGAGCSEIAGVCQIAGFGSALPFLVRGLRRPVAVALLGSCLGLALVALSPGNVTRRAILNEILDPKPFPVALGQTITGTVSATAALAERSLPFVLLAIPLALTWPVASRPWRWRVTGMSITVMCGVVAASLLTSIWSLGGPPPPRAEFATSAWVTVSLFALVMIWAPAIPDRLIIRTLLLAASLTGLVCGPLRYATARVATVKEARDFAVAADALDAFARANPGSDVRAPAPRNFEGLEFISRDPMAWSSRDVARFYRLSSIAWRNQPALTASRPARPSGDPR